MNYDINTPLPDADYTGPLFGPDWVPAKKESFAEALDRKCSEMEYQNSWYRND